MIDQNVRGFIFPNSIIDELLPELSHSELKCYLCVLRKTKGWNKEEDAISVSQFMKVTGLSNKAVISACESLVEREILERKSGDRNTGIYSIKTYKSATSEKSSLVKNFPSTSEKSSQVTSEKSSHTINNIKNNIQNITPLSPYGESANAEHTEVGGADKPHTGKKQNSINVNYSAVAETYNDLVKELNSNLPLIANPSQLSDKRKKAIKKLAQVFIKRFEIDTDVESALGEYFKDFLKSAPNFYFGENNRGWKADFEYILRETTLDKVLEGNW